MVHAATLTTSCLVLPAEIIVPAWETMPAWCQAFMCPALPAERELPAIGYSNASIRYVLRQEPRYYVQIEGTFEAYLTRFSGKTRNTFRRHAKRFAERSGGDIVWRSYTTPDELRAFYAAAIGLSRNSYQHALGYGLLDSAAYVDDLAQLASAGRVRAYLLWMQDQAVAYAVCPIDGEVMLYERLGFDPAFEDLSPGRVLLLLILEHLFKEKPVRLLDFGSQAFSYKAQFATGSIPTARIIYFRPTIRNMFMLGAHAAVRGIWRGLSNARALLRRLFGTGSAK